MIENANQNIDFPNANDGDAVGKKEGSPDKSFTPIDPGLLEAIRRGDHQAFHELYLDTVEVLFNFINLLLHSESESEEICQQIFVRIWEKRETIDPASNFKGYLYKMAKTAAFKHMAHRKVENNYVNYKLNDTPDFGDSPDELVMSDEMALLINISLANMPEQRRRVFEMSRYEGLDYDEIAKRLNITNATVRSHLSHAIKELRELLALLVFFFVTP